MPPSACACYPGRGGRGRFTVPDAEIALSAVAGGLPGLLRLFQRHPE
jgi:hypothetical protein